MQNSWTPVVLPAYMRSWCQHRGPHRRQFTSLAIIHHAAVGELKDLQEFPRGAISMLTETMYRGDRKLAHPLCGDQRGQASEGTPPA